MDEPALQSQHSSGVPNVPGADGGAELHRILYHALSGEFWGREYSLSNVSDAGFTAVHVWELHRLDAILEDVRRSGLRLVVHCPTDEEIVLLRDTDTVLAWYLDEEPSFFHSELSQEDRREVFRKRYNEIRNLDPGPPIFLLDGPPLERVREEWLKWAVLGDIAVHNYYAANDRLTAYSPAAFVASSVRRARLTIPKDRPIWFNIQAFSDSQRSWRMPTPEEYRSMAMAALTQGATGLVVFALDSFVTRDDNVVGIAPDPIGDYRDLVPDGSAIADYNEDGKPPGVATEDDLQKSRNLWKTVAEFNRFLEALEAPLLSPTETRGLQATSWSAEDDEEFRAPVRVMAKSHEGALYLFMVNLSKQATWVKVSCRRSECGGASVVVSELRVSGETVDTVADRHPTTLTKLEGEGIRVFRLTSD